MPTVDVKEELRELIARNISLEIRVEELEKEARHFSRQFDILMLHQTKVDNLALVHECKIDRLEQKGNNGVRK